MLEASDLAGQPLPGEVRLDALEGETPEGWRYRAMAPDRRQVEALVLPANPDGPGPAPADLVGRVRCRVRQERIEAAARFQHPQVVRILATGLTPQGHPFVVRERPAGAPLSEYLSTATLLPPAVVLTLGADTAEALAAAHAAGLVHGNLSPAMLQIIGGPAAPAVTLLGLTLGPFLQTRDEAVRLGGGHASPEQRFPIAADERSDIYSLGAVLYHALTGAPPSPEASIDALPRSARAVLASALQEHPERRPESMSAFAAALRRAARGAPAAPGQGEPEPWERPSGADALRRRARVSAAAAVAVIGLGVWLSRARAPAAGGAAFDAREPAEVALSPGAPDAAPGVLRDSASGAASRSAVEAATTPPSAAPARPTPAQPTPLQPTPVQPTPATTSSSPAEAEFGGVVVGQSWAPAEVDFSAVVVGQSWVATGSSAERPSVSRSTADRSGAAREQGWVSPFRRSHPWAASPTGPYYYPSGCPAALQLRDLQFFRTQAQARASGFVPAPDSACS